MNLSVIIPVYNKGYVLEKTLTSVFEQTRIPNEVIIINDGSTDNSLFVINEFINKNKNKKISVKVINVKNGGVSKARNLGVKNASYEYIAFLDSDDLWDKDYLFEMNELITNYPSAIMFGCRNRVFRNGIIYKSKEGGVASGIIDFFKESIKESVVNSSKVIVKKNIITAIPFPEDSKYGEDIFVWINIAIKGDVAYLDKELVTINQYEDESRLLRMNEVFYPLIAINKINNKSLKCYLKHLFKKTYLVRLKEGNKDIAIETLKCSFRLFPLYTLLMSVFVFFPISILEKAYLIYKKTRA